MIIQEASIPGTWRHTTLWNINSSFWIVIFVIHYSQRLRMRFDHIDLMTLYYKLYYWVCQWEDFENRSNFYEVINLWNVTANCSWSSLYRRVILLSVTASQRTERPEDRLRCNLLRCSYRVHWLVLSMTDRLCLVTKLSGQFCVLFDTSLHYRAPVAISRSINQ